MNERHAGPAGIKYWATRLRGNETNNTHSLILPIMSRKTTKIGLLRIEMELEISETVYWILSRFGDGKHAAGPRLGFEFNKSYANFALRY